MSNYLKNSLFCLLILMLPYMNVASHSMDMEDYEGSTVRCYNVVDDQKDVSSSVKQSNSSQLINLEDSQTSWASYFLSPAKYVVQNAYDVMRFASKSPRHALFIGTFMTLQTLVAAQDCCVANCWWVLGQSCEQPSTKQIKTCGPGTPMCAYKPGCYDSKVTGADECTRMYSSATSSVVIMEGACRNFTIH